MTTIIRSGLFGGALLGAGIAAGDARAQGFAHGDSFATISADRISGADVYLMPVAPTPLGVGTVSYSGSGFVGVATLDTDLLEFTHNRSASNVFSYSNVAVKAFIYPMEDLTAHLSWDFGAWGGWAFDIVEMDGGPFQFGAASASGSATVPLLRGSGYVVVALTQGFTPGGASWARMEVAQRCPADIDGNGVINLDDIGAFVDGFLLGCP